MLTVIAGNTRESAVKREPGKECQQSTERAEIAAPETSVKLFQGYNSYKNKTGQAAQLKERLLVGQYTVFQNSVNRLGKVAEPFRCIEIDWVKKATYNEIEDRINGKCHPSDQDRKWIEKTDKLQFEETGCQNNCKQNVFGSPQ